ncbi:hypothetical protein J0S82_002953, partial [Galemys pyrenaicus]
ANESGCDGRLGKTESESGSTAVLMKTLDSQNFTVLDGLYKEFKENDSSFTKPKFYRMQQGLGIQYWGKGQLPNRIAFSSNLVPLWDIFWIKICLIHSWWGTSAWYLGPGTSVHAKMLTAVSWLELLTLPVKRQKWSGTPPTPEPSLSPAAQSTTSAPETNMPKYAEYCEVLSTKATRLQQQLRMHEEDEHFLPMSHYTTSWCSSRWPFPSHQLAHDGEWESNFSPIPKVKVPPLVLTSIYLAPSSTTVTFSTEVTSLRATSTTQTTIHAHCHPPDQSVRTAVASLPESSNVHSHDLAHLLEAQSSHPGGWERHRASDWVQYLCSPDEGLPHLHTLSPLALILSLPEKPAGPAKPGVGGPDIASPTITMVMPGDPNFLQGLTNFLAAIQMVPPPSPSSPQPLPQSSSPGPHQDALLEAQRILEAGVLKASEGWHCHCSSSCCNPSTSTTCMVRSPHPETSRWQPHNDHGARRIYAIEFFFRAGSSRVGGLLQPLYEETVEVQGSQRTSPKSQ